jgi:hypothetical protein
MRRTPNWHRAEINLARRKWAGVGIEKLTELRKFVERYHFSVALGDVLYINNSWYITHAGLLRLAHRRRCLGIKTILERRCSDPLSGRWIFKAIVYKSLVSKSFVGYGDADPSNVSPLVRGAEMRVPEPSIALFARLMASASVPSKSLDGNRRLTARPIRNAPRQLSRTMGTTTVSPASATASAS